MDRPIGIKIEVGPRGFSPTFGSAEAIGADLYTPEDFSLRPHERISLGLDIKIAVPQGYAGFICSRSGLAKKYGVTVLNDPGVIDSDYRGEVRVLLYNSELNGYVLFYRGDRIAQLILKRSYPFGFDPVSELEIDTERGEGGFGSTGR